MGVKEDWIKEVYGAYEQIKKHKVPYEIEIRGIKIIIYPNVFSPFYFSDSAWFAEVIPEIVAKRKFLEIGTGTGIVSLFAALAGAQVTATDINENAVENAKENFKRHDVPVSSYHGDMYAPIPTHGKYDVIFWNHPFNNADNPHEEMLLRAGFDYRYESLEKYVAQARSHLSVEGELLLGSGNFADIAEIEKIAARHDFSLEIIQRTERLLTEKSTLSNSYVLYQFKKSLTY